MLPGQRHHVVIAGAGIAGSTAALALGELGHDVTVVERDEEPPPAPSHDADEWGRRGVAQFAQPHAFLARMFAELDAGLPDVSRRLTDAGAVPLQVGPTARAAWCRRSTFERVLREAVAEHPAVRTVNASVRGVQVGADGAVTGIRLAEGGTLVPADVVVDATGRRGRLARSVEVLATSEQVWDEPCDEVYTSRRYRLHPGAQPGTVNRGVIAVSEADGYTVLVFPHDDRFFTITFTRLPDDEALAGLRDERLFDRAVAAVPLAAEWAQPQRSAPVSSVMVMAGSRNRFRRAGDGAPLGLHALGDTVCTTNPHFGRGSTLAVVSALRLATAVAADPGDARSWREQHEAWQRTELWGWFDDARMLDRARSAAWRAVVHGTPAPTVSAEPAPRHAVLAAAGLDPEIGRAVAAHFQLLCAPDALDALAPRATELLSAPRPAFVPGRPRPAAGPRPPVVPPAPSRESLVEAVLGHTLAVTG